MLSVLITGRMFDPEACRILESAGHRVIWLRRDVAADELMGYIADADAYIIAGNEKVTADHVDKARSLCRIVVMATVYGDWVDVPYATSKGIDVRGTPHRSSESVAEITFALMLAAARGIVALGAAVERGDWSEKSFGGLEGRTLGILGMGSIGSLVARIGMRGFSRRACITVAPAASTSRRS